MLGLENLGTLFKLLKLNAMRQIIQFFIVIPLLEKVFT